MGAGWVDEELDGKREVFITGTDEAMFLKDTGNLQYTDVAPEYGMPSEIVTGWSVLGVDFDNDGWEDIYATSADWVVYTHPPPPSTPRSRTNGTGMTRAMAGSTAAMNCPA